MRPLEPLTTAQKTYYFTRVGTTLSDSARFRAFSPDAENESLKRLVYALEADVLTDHREVVSHTVTLSENVTFHPPATWWDHLKASRAGTWGWRWLVRRWPAQTTTVTEHVEKSVQVDLHSDLTYPEAGITPAEFGRPFVVERYTDRVVYR